MNIIKLTESTLKNEGTPCVITVESITCVRFNNDITYVTLNDGTTIEIPGNNINKMAKLISMSTNGNMLTLE